MTIGHLIAEAQKKQLRIEMEVFLSYLLDKDRSDLTAYPEFEIPVEKLSELQKGWVKILEGYPVAYLTHHKEFYGLDFFVNEDVLIPRDATERLVEFALERLSRGAKVIEVGTGSGAISVALKSSRPDLEIISGDVSESALDVATKNAATNKTEINFLESDLLINFPPHSEFPAELLVTNLPYIGEVEHRYISDNVETFEPHLALFGGHDGLELYRKLFKQIKDQGRELKWIMGEFGFTHGVAAKELCTEFFPDYDFKLEKDYEGLDRYFILTHKSATLPEKIA